MAITYAAGVITVTGYTEATPCNFTDIYNADVSGGWGKVTRQCTNQFCSTARLIIGDGSTSTWFADTKKHVLFNGAITAGWQRLIEVKNSAQFMLGTVIDETKKITKDGCSITLKDQSESYLFLVVHPTASIKIYSSYLDGGITDPTLRVASIEPTGSPKTPTVRIYNTLTLGVVFAGFQSGSNGILFNITQEYSYFGFSTCVLDIDNCICTGTAKEYIRVYIGTQESTFKNIYMRGNPDQGFQVYQTSYDIHLINADIDKWTIWWKSPPYCTIYRKYEFDLKVVDSGGTGIDTAKTKIWDKDDNLVTNTTTNASGVLAMQTLNYGYYNQAGGNVATMQTPHDMRIYKYGKEMLSSKSSIEAKTDWALTMNTDDHITQTTEATVAAYTGITINHAAETITISANHTLDEIYDYCQYDIIASTKQLDQTMHTADGVNFVSEYSFIVNTGITVTATDQKLSMVSGETYTLTGTAQFTGIIATTTTTRIPIKLTNVVDGSRYWVGKQSDGTKIFEGTQSGSGTVTGYYEHTANIDIDIRARKSSASVKYKPWVGEGTLIAEAFSLRIRQIQDSIVT